ncbi:MAG: helix-turn-helix transcriptional regulator, partial [Rhodobacter sp.]|nr:helix-turn-helix transcriptional regulator [Rhodobacter sp.]
MPDDQEDFSTTLPRGKPVFNQDPHRVRELSERTLELAIGREVRACRRQQGMTVADLAEATGLSIGMLSKIENGITSPSLTTLQILAHAFSTPITSFFRRFEERREVQHVKAGDHVEIERRGTRAGHQYNLLGHIGSNSSGVVVEP